MEEKQKIVPVVDKGNVVIKKKPWITRFKDAFIMQDFRVASDSVVKNIVVPAAKSAFINMVNGFLTGILYDNNAPRGTGIFGAPMQNLWSSAWNGATYAGQNINYSGVSKPPTTMGFVPSTIMNYQDIEIQPNMAVGETMDDAQRKAQQVIETLVDQLTRYQKVPIAELFDACGLVAQAPMYNYGWTTMQGAHIQFTGTGFKFVMPSPVPLK